MNLGFRHLIPSSVTAAALLGLCGSAAGSPLVADVFLFSEYSVTRFPSSPSVVTIEGTAGVRLGMDATQPKVTEVNPLGGSQTFSFDGTPTYAGHAGFVDSLRRELSPDIAAQVAAEISEVDDQGPNDQGAIVTRDEGRRSDNNNDAGFNIDFYRRDDSLTLAIPTGKAWTQLVLVEDAGLDWMRLEHCAEASCSNPTAFFDGFGTDPKTHRSLRNELTEMPGFSRKDNTEAVDQAWVFLLSEPLQGFFRITYVRNWGGQGLELDFVSGTSQGLRPRAVPGPNPLLLLGMGLVALYLVRRQGHPGSRVLRTGTSRQS